MKKHVAQPMIEPWEVVSKKAYWDRDVDLQRWRDRIAIGHRSYLPDAIKAMHPREFIHFYGKKAFALDWPRLRAQLPTQAHGHCPIYDVFWSQLAGGGYDLKPFADYYDLPERRRQFLRAVAKKPGQSIYEVAMSLNMQYRRAHDHATALMRENRIRGKEVIDNSRRKIKLYPTYGRAL